MQVVFSSTAYADLDAIYDFIHRDSPQYAYSVVQDIKLWCATQLSVIPRRGRIMRKNPETGEAVGPYRYNIRFIIHENSVIITMIYKWQERSI